MATQATASSERPHGPSALGTSAHRFLELTLTLARTDFKLRYFGSALGYFWQLARPLLFFGVIYVFFTQILAVGKGVPHYGVYLLTGIVLWTFFAEATGTSVGCLVAREAMLRKIRFPRLAVPFSVVLTSTFNLAMNSIAVVVFALANGVSPRLSWLWMLPIMLGFLVFAAGVGLVLSSLYVRFRDIQPIWEVALQVLFYATPIMYISTFYKGLEHLALLNPLALMLTQMGHAFIHPARSLYTVAGKTAYGEPMRSAWAAAGGFGHFAVSIALIPAVFGFGLWLFRREAPHFAENL